MPIVAEYYGIGLDLPNQLKLAEKGEKLYGGPTEFGSYNNLIGIEVERESTTSAEDLPNLFYWTITNDSSLKLNGKEFISKPICKENIDYALNELFDSILQKETSIWSHRTSIHVHTDVRHLTLVQVQNFVAVYAILEDLFFSLVDPIRSGGAFCFPITDLSVQEVEIPASDVENSKYCALNFGNALAKHGTIEFRHMHGHNNKNLLKTWIKLIGKLQTYIEENTTSAIKTRIKHLCSKKDYWRFLNDIFGNEARVFIDFDLRLKMYSPIKWALLYLKVI